VSCGLDPARFWALTPRELSLHVAGARERFIREHNENMSLAWHVARLNAYAPQKAREFPKLESLLHSEGPKPGPVQSVEDQIAVLKGIFAGRKR